MGEFALADHAQSLKEVVRHLLYRAGGPRALRALKRIRKLPTVHLADSRLEERFSTIYRERVWSSGGSASGPGSDLARISHRDLREGR